MVKLEAHAKPPDEIRTLYKHYQKQRINELDRDASIVQATVGADATHLQHRLLDLPREIRQIFLDYLGPGDRDLPLEDHEPSRPYEVEGMPGLIVYPSIIPPVVQLDLLDKLLLRDLSNPQHKTNVHMHYDVPYPTTTYFHPDASRFIFSPKDPTVHQPITGQQYLDKKLRWMTLGGQYDWTNKVYPPSAPPPFPPDVKSLVEALFPLKAEAAIVNLYQPGDTLSLHRDVSEPTPHVRPLVSISLGCDALFMVGLNKEEKPGDTGNEHAGGGKGIITIRLRSGDAVVMSGDSRYAWHGVPKVMEDTCPDWMQEWPYRNEPPERECFQHWKGWASGKRINLNVRQMFD